MVDRQNIGSNSESFVNSLAENIRTIVTDGRRIVASSVNRELIITYWSIGKEIVQSETKNGIDAQSSRQLILSLSKRLTLDVGRGFSRTNLFTMRKLYMDYSDVQTLSGQLSWSHLSELLTIEKKEKRSFYEKETVNSGWSVRELKRQIDSSLYERLLLSDGKSNKEQVLRLSRDGQELVQPEDVLKDPYVFEFLGIPETRPIQEKELEQRLIRHIEDFLLELGKGFMFVGSQQRITINNTHFYVDMVFYNKVLRCYILIELKTTKLKISDAGQLNTYLNYYNIEVNEPSDNPPIGIVLCAEKDEIAAEYILGGLENKVFASKFTYVLPNKDELEKQLERALLDDGKNRKER